MNLADLSSSLENKYPVADYVNLQFTVPASDASRLIEILIREGAGEVGDYKGAYFSTKGMGHWIPDENAKPYIGEIGKPSVELEEYISIDCRKDRLEHVMKILLQNHPYEQTSVLVLPYYQFAMKGIKKSSASP